MLASFAPVLGVMKFETTPLGFDDWRRLTWLAIEWVQDAGGFAMVGLVAWLLNGLIYPVNDLLPDGRKRNRLVGPGMLLAGAAALTGYLIALGLTTVVAEETPGTKMISFLGREGSMMGLFLEIALFTSGLIALIGFGGPFVVDCLRMRWGRIYAIAKLSFTEAVRRRVVWVFLVILILYLFPARWFFQEKPEDELKSIIGVTTRGMNVLMVAVGLLLAAFSIPSDIKNLTIHTIVTKPVERFEIVLGRFLGYLGLITAALVIMTGFGLVLINAGNVSEEAAAESMRSRVARYGRLEFKSQKASDFVGMDVGREDGYRKYIAGRSSQRAVWNFTSFPDRFDTEKSVRLEFAFDIYRTTKGTEGTGVQVTFEVVSHTWDADRRIDDPANPGAQIRMEDAFNRDIQGLVNVSPDDAAKWAKVDALAEQYGRYVFNNLSVNDYHTSSIPVPGGVFRNANKTAPTRDGPIKAGAKQSPPRLQVKVRCESPSQFIGAARYDLYFLEAEGSFSFNYFKGAAGLWYRLVIALAIAIALSTYLSGVLSFLTALMLFISGFFLEYIQDLAKGGNTGGGPLESLARLIKNTTPTSEMDPNPVVRVLQGGDAGARWLLRRVMNVIPDVDRYGMTDYVAQGFSIGPDLLLINLITLSGYVLPWFVAAYYLMKAREIAA